MDHAGTSLHAALAVGDPEALAAKMTRWLSIVVLALLASCWSLLPASAQTAGACTAGCNNYVTNQVFTGTSVSGNITVASTGDTIRGGYCYNGPTAVTLTVNGSPIIGASQPTGAGYTCALFNKNNNPSGSVTITLTATTGTCSDCSFFADTWTATSTTGSQDGQSGTWTQTSSALAPSGSFTTTGVDTIETYLFGGGGGPTAPSGYTVAQNEFATDSWGAAYKTSVTAGAQNPAWTVGSTFSNNFNLVAGFTVTGAASPTAGQLPMMGIGG
jgi:hypothetical protein